jgi:hypothetical protein
MGLLDKLLEDAPAAKGPRSYSSRSAAFPPDEPIFKVRRSTWPDGRRSLSAYTLEAPNPDTGETSFFRLSVDDRNLHMDSQPVRSEEGWLAFEQAIKGAQLTKGPEADDEA